MQAEKDAQDKLNALADRYQEFVCSIVFYFHFQSSLEKIKQGVLNDASRLDEIDKAAKQVLNEFNRETFRGETITYKETEKLLRNVFTCVTG